MLDAGGSARVIAIVDVSCGRPGNGSARPVYDDIAPKLTDQFHVYAVTRRGVGASDRSATGYDPARRAADYPRIPVDTANLPKQAGKPPPVVFPEAERRQLAERPVDPTIRKAIVEDNNVRPVYARISVPVLAIFRATTIEPALKDYPPENDLQRAALAQGYASRRAMLEKWEADLRAGVPHARIVELPGANLYMFNAHAA